MKKTFFALLLTTSALVPTQARPLRKGILLTNNWNRKEYSLNIEEDSKGQLERLVLQAEEHKRFAVTFSELAQGEEKCVDSFDLLDEGRGHQHKVLCFEAKEDFRLHTGGTIFIKYLYEAGHSRPDIRFAFAIQVERDRHQNWAFYFERSLLSAFKFFGRSYYGTRLGLREIHVNGRSILDDVELVP